MKGRLTASNGSSKLAALSCVARGFRAAGQQSPHYHNLPMGPSLSDRWWIHGVQDYLDILEMKLIRNGPVTPLTDNWIGKDLTIDQKATYARLGIATTGENFMEGDTLNIPLQFDLPLQPPCPQQPICLRSGQVWQQDDLTIWEILSINKDHLQVIYWQRKANDPTTLFLDEDNFCQGAGSQHMIPKATILNIGNGQLLTLDIELHRADGNTYSKILFTRPRNFYWPYQHNVSLADGLLNVMAEHSLPNKVRDIYTDGSWMVTGSAATRLLKNGIIRAHGAVVLEDITERGPPVYFGIKIIGSNRRPKSAYIYELLSIALAALISPNVNASGSIRSDCISAIKSSTKCWRGRGLYRTYPLLGAAISNLKPCRITHIKAHPEKKKLDKVWTDQDCGIFVADRTASDTKCNTTRLGILDDTVLDIITLTLPYVYWDNDNMHVLEDLHDRYHRIMATRYLHKRDIFRTTDPINPRPAKWTGMNLTLMAHIANTKKLNLAEGCKAALALFDWYHIGSNRIKGNPLAKDKCYLCGQTEDRAHILHRCNHAELARLRTDLLEEMRGDIALLTPGPACKAAWAIFNLLETPTGHQIMTGQMEPALRLLINQDPALSTNLSTFEWKTIDQILCKMGIAALNILRTHIRLTCWHINGKKPSGLVRTTIGLQRSITSSFNPVMPSPQPKSKPAAITPTPTVDTSQPTDQDDTLLTINLNRLKPSGEPTNLTYNTTPTATLPKLSITHWIEPPPHTPPPPLPLPQLNPKKRHMTSTDLPLTTYQSNHKKRTDLCPHMLTNNDPTGTTENPIAHALGPLSLMDSNNDQIQSLTPNEYSSPNQHPLEPKPSTPLQSAKLLICTNPSPPLTTTDTTNLEPTNPPTSLISSMTNIHDTSTLTTVVTQTSTPDSTNTTTPPHLSPPLGNNSSTPRQTNKRKHNHHPLYLQPNADPHDSPTQSPDTKRLKDICPPLIPDPPHSNIMTIPVPNNNTIAIHDTTPIGQHNNKRPSPSNGEPEDETPPTHKRLKGQPTSMMTLQHNALVSNPTHSLVPHPTHGIDDPTLHTNKRPCPPSNPESDDEPPVKRKQHSRNIINDDTEIIRRGRGTWAPYNPNSSSEARTNKKFMKSLQTKNKPDG